MATFCITEKKLATTPWKNIFITKEAFKSVKNQIQVDHVNIFGPGYTEDGLLLQFKKMIKEEETSNNVTKINHTQK